jgi:hypothetical protein
MIPPSTKPVAASLAVKSADLSRTWISMGPFAREGLKSCAKISWMCGIVVSLTGNGRVIPALIPTQR